MRVISGKFKGKKLTAPRDETVRPTLGRIKETLFNIIQFDVADSNFLDLFAGCGSIGIEAESRGACEVLYCDNERDSVKLIKENLRSIDSDSFVYEGDYKQLLKKQPKGKFDFIYIDPPFETSFASTALALIDEKEILAENGKIIVEHLSASPIVVTLKNLEMTQSRKMGAVTLTFFERIK